MPNICVCVCRAHVYSCVSLCAVYVYVGVHACACV